MLEDLKPEINSLKARLDEMGASLDIERKEEKIAELEYKMGEPTFWDDAEYAQKINQELNDVKISKASFYSAGDTSSAGYYSGS